MKTGGNTEDLSVETTFFGTSDVDEERIFIAAEHTTD
jgi:hypothetical protein